jgi:hypothetical protein
MKHVHFYFLPAYIIYLGFVPVTPAHAAIVAALATLYGYQLYLNTLESIKLNKELATLREEFNQRVGQIKEASDEEISKLRDEVGKVALVASRLPSSSVNKPGLSVKF